jgi:hypothetical protein
MVAHLGEGDQFGSGFPICHEFHRKCGRTKQGDCVGLMTPPGLGFVAAGERARHAHRKAGLRTPCWDWSEQVSKLSREWPVSVSAWTKESHESHAPTRCEIVTVCLMRREPCSAPAGRKMDQSAERRDWRRSGDASPGSIARFRS